MRFPYENDEMCDICCRPADFCECPVCPKCDASGRIDCVGKKGHVPIEQYIFHGAIPGTLLRHAFKDYKSPHDLYRSFYKYGEHPLTISITYYDRCKTLHNSELPNKWDGIITEMNVSAIVEGVEQTTDTYGVELVGTVKDIHDSFYSIEEQVCFEAESIWNETHGCHKCAGVKEKDWEPGNTPINPKCRGCRGKGVVI